jgi:hypothetical protein
MFRSLKAEPFSLVDGTMKHNLDVASQQGNDVRDGLLEFAGEVVMPHLYIEHNKRV